MRSPDHPDERGHDGGDSAHSGNEGGQPDLPEERALVASIRMGDEGAFRALFEQYYEPLVAWAERLVQHSDAARDIVEDVFTRLWLRRDTLDLRGSITAYLYTAVRLEAIDYRRHQASVLRRDQAVAHDLIESHTVPGLGATPQSPDTTVAVDELRAAIRDAIRTLPERCAIIVTLRWEHQLSHAEIAQTLGIAVKTVENQLTIAFRALRERLDEFRDGAS